MNKRRKIEAKTVEVMIKMYCNDHHQSTILCNDCNELVIYAQQKGESCVFGDEKPVCSQCKVHCYQPEQRKKIRDVMRYSGPKMIFRHPFMAILHLLFKRNKAKTVKEFKTQKSI